MVARPKKNVAKVLPRDDFAAEFRTDFRRSFTRLNIGAELLTRTLNIPFSIDPTGIPLASPQVA